MALCIVRPDPDHARPDPEGDLRAGRGFMGVLNYSELLLEIWITRGFPSPVLDPTLEGDGCPELLLS